MSEKKAVKRSGIIDDGGDGHTALSDDLVEEILIRLPTNTLFRCNCVCKRWHALISSSSFIERVKSFPMLTAGFFFCVDLPNALIKPDLFFYETYAKVIQLDISLSFLQRPVVPVASHKGLLLCVKRPDSGIFSVIDSFNYILCHPYAKQWVTLPKPRCDHRIKFVTLYCYKKDGSNTHPFEFKVVVSLIDVFCHNVIELEIYSSETGQWNVSTIFHHLGFLRPSCPIVLLDGSIHFWNPDTRHLCVYNLMEESIRFMELPVGPFNISGMGHLGVSAESLYYSEGTRNHFRVWVLLDGAEWFLKHSIDFESLMDELDETLESDYLFYPVAFHPLNDNIVLVRMIHSPKVVLYHIDTTKIEVRKNVNSSLYFPVIPYALPAWHPFIKNH